MAYDKSIWDVPRLREIAEHHIPLTTEQRCANLLAQLDIILQRLSDAVIAHDQAVIDAYQGIYLRQCNALRVERGIDDAKHANLLSDLSAALGHKAVWLTDDEPGATDTTQGPQP
jgi:hypothetical protein